MARFIGVQPDAKTATESPEKSGDKVVRKPRAKKAQPDQVEKEGGE